MFRFPLALAVLAAVVPAQAGSYSLFGAGCQGTGPGPGPVCGGANTMGSGLRGLSNNSNTFCLEVAATASARNVTGFEVFTKFNGGGSSVTVPVAIHFATAGGAPEVTAKRTGTMIVQSAAAWYSASIAPIMVPANQKFFVTYGDTLARQTDLPILSTGTSAVHYWHPPSTTTWRGPFTTQRWGFRVNCGGGSSGAVPVLSNTGAPTIGQSFSVDIGRAKVSSVALVAIGASKSTWAGIPLPLDVSPYGANGCTLLVSLDFVQPRPVSATGTASLNLAIPNQSVLVGQKFFNQALVVDTVNTLGFAFTNGGEATVGR